MTEHRSLRRRARVAASALLAVLVFAGCASIPTSGSVNAGNRPVDTDAPEFDLIARGPVSGMTQDQILRGFIDAATSARKNYEVARDYLAPGFSSEWRADAGATIDVLSERTITEVESTLLRVEATPLAQLGPDGQYDVLGSSTAIPLDYRFEDVDGEWRIAEAPPGILIDESSFGLVYSEHTLYFYDSAFEYLVPDLRWFAGRGSLQTSIVRALIDGPTEWLAPGVNTAIPEGATLNPDSVPVDGAVAHVELTGAVFDSPLAVQRMQTQIDASLSSVRNVDEVELRVNGDLIELAALSPAPQRNPRVDERAAVANAETFGYLAAAGESITPIDGMSEQIDLLRANAVALGRNADTAAVRSEEGVSLVRVDAEPQLLDSRDALVAPTIDGSGYVWSVPRNSPEQLRWFDADGTATSLAVPWTGTKIAAIDVSRDSTRLLALLAEGDRTRFVVASIERDSEGRPIALGQVPLSLIDVVGTPRDVAWLDADTVAALVEVDGGATRVVRQQLGGLATQFAGPADGIAIEGGNSQRDLRVLTSTGVLATQTGVGWQPQAENIRLLASQQPD